MQRTIEFDQDRNRYVCRIGGPGDAVIETDTAQDMQDFLADRCHYRVSVVKTHGTTIHVKLERKPHHAYLATETE